MTGWWLAFAEAKARDGNEHVLRQLEFPPGCDIGLESVHSSF